MSSINGNLFSINGLINTDSTVIDNLNTLCTASGCWLTYDIGQGKWAIVINNVGSSVASFNDSNIIGSINISGTGLSELYNKVQVEFPHKDLKDATDFVELTIPSEDRYPNEFDNTLNIKIDIINDPIQAQVIGGRELKQSRVDKVIEFKTDFSYINLTGGDLIDITSEMYGYTNKVFRIVSVEEDDSEEFIISIKALEYDSDVYDISDLAGGLVRTERSNQTGIVPKTMNPVAQASDELSVGEQMSRLLIANGAASLLGSLFKRIAGTNKFGPSDAGKDLDKLLRGFKKPSLTSFSSPTAVCEGDDIDITINVACSGTCFLDIPNFDYNWSIVGVFEEDIDFISINGVEIDVALSGTVTVGSSAVSMNIKTGPNSGGNTLSLTIGGVNRSIVINNISNVTYVTSVSNNGVVTEGNNASFTVTTTNVPNGTVIPYTLTGALSRTTASSTGNITINNGTATKNISTINDGTYQGTGLITFTISPTLPDAACHGTWDFSASVYVTDQEDYVPPYVPPPDVTRQYELVPVIWVGTYDGTSGQLKSAAPIYARLPIPFAGEASVAVPTAISISQGNPSTITITGYRAIATSSTIGGTSIDVITAFNTVAPNAQITGTRTTVYGYFVN